MTDVYPGQSTTMKSGWLNLIPSAANWTHCVGNEAALNRGLGGKESAFKYGENNVRKNKQFQGTLQETLSSEIHTRDLHS